MLLSLKILIVLTSLCSISSLVRFTSAQDINTSGYNDKSGVLINVNHVIDFLQSIKKSQDDMTQKIDVLTRSVESTDREEHRTRTRLSRKVSTLEIKVAELERTLPFKMEEMIRNKLSQGNLPSLLRPPVAPSFSTRSSRDIAYFEPFRDSKNPQSNYFRPQLNPPVPLPLVPQGTPAIADKQGYVNIQLLEESKQKMSEFNQSLELIKHKLFDVEKTFEYFNKTHFGEVTPVRKSESELEEKFASNAKDVAALKEKQGELQRAIDTVVIHFASIMRSLENTDKKIEQTHQNVTEEIKRHISTTHRVTQPVADDPLGSESVAAQTLQSTWHQRSAYVRPAASALTVVNEKPASSSPNSEPENKVTRKSQSDQNSSEIYEAVGNLTKEFRVQKEQISVISSELAKVNISQILLMRTMDEETLKVHTNENNTVRPKDCSEIRLFRNGTSGAFAIFPELNDNPVEVLCDLETDGGGWTIIQRRGHPLKSGETRESFFRNWTQYENGFGSLDSDFWLGLSKIASLCKLGDQELRIEMTKWDGERSITTYKHFKISDARNLYKLSISGYSGDAGDSLSRHNGKAFSTFDRDNDSDPQRNCAQMWKGAWWYYGCHESNLNGLYARDGTEGANDFGTGIIWYHWTGNYYSLKSVQMKIRNSFVVRNIN